MWELLFRKIIAIFFISADSDSDLKITREYLDGVVHAQETNNISNNPLFFFFVQNEIRSKKKGEVERCVMMMIKKNLMIYEF